MRELAGSGAAPSPDVRIPFNAIQKRAGAALLASAQTVPYAYATALTRYSAIEAVRLEQRERFRSDEGFALTYLPFVARAVVDALREFPLLNAHVADDALTVRARVDLGFAVDLAHQGLVVPVVRGAETLDLRGIARAVHDLATRARARALTPDDVAPATFTITNPGAAGTWMSFPVLHRPAVAILSTDGVAKRVVADTDVATGRDRMVVAPCGYLCCAFDHRAVDGAYVGAFLARLCEVLATRDWRAEL